MNTNEYIDAIKEKHHLASDYKLGKLLSISPARISNYRQGVSFINDELAVKIANALEIPLGNVLLDIHAERAKDENVKKVWLELSKKLGGIAAGVLLATNVQLAQQENGNFLQISDLEPKSYANYILC